MINWKQIKQLLITFSLVSIFAMQTACDITFKRKSPATPVTSSVAMEEKKLTEKSSSEKSSGGSRFSKSRSKRQQENRRTLGGTDKQRIMAYYKDPANAQVLEDMINHTRISAKQAKKLKVTKRIPGDIRVIPLPLELERILTPLNSRVLRVQVGKRVIIMDVRSRQIIDLIKLDI